MTGILSIMCRLFKGASICNDFNWVLAKFDSILSKQGQFTLIVKLLRFVFCDINLLSITAHWKLLDGLRQDNRSIFNDDGYNNW